MTQRVLAAVAVAWLLAAAPSLAAAQHTGSSFGGSDFEPEEEEEPREPSEPIERDDPPAPSYRAPSRPWPSFDSPAPSYDSERTGPRAGRPPAAAEGPSQSTFAPTPAELAGERADAAAEAHEEHLSHIASGAAFLALVLLVCGIAWNQSRSERSAKERDEKEARAVLARLAMPVGVPSTAVAVVSLAVDARTRRFLQRKLERLAHDLDGETRDGLAKLLRETVDAIVAVRTGWAYVGGRHTCPMVASDAKVAFLDRVDDLRLRFQRIVIRRRDAPPRPVAPADGVVVVSLVVAATRDLADASSARDAVAVERVLRALAAITPAQLVAFEVIWSPFLETDQMSTEELETVHPDLSALDPTPVADRVHCDHCDGPRARALAVCPDCGAAASR